MGRRVDIPWVGGSIYHELGWGRYTMGRGVDILWVWGQYTLGKGSIYHGEGVDIPWVGGSICHG